MSALRYASVLVLSGVIFGMDPSARAMDLDWHGQFRVETNWLWGYSNGQLKPNNTNDAGYSVFYNGSSPASFQNLFFALSPRVIVNDNVSLHSNLWLGTPDRGVFGGDGLTNSTIFSANRAGNAAVLANTFYGELATDFGTVTFGRAPLHWGLGVVWNYDQDGFYRLPSTGDTLKLVTKLGAFKFMPSVVKYNIGSNYGGSTSGNGTLEGTSGVVDYSVGLSYTNDDEQMDIGLLFLRRLAGPNADIVDPLNTGTGKGGFAYNIWDFYAKKKAGMLTLAAEVPLVTGFVAGKDYSSVAAAAKIQADLSESWKLKFNGGLADGQASSSTPANKYTAFYFHPDYRPGLIMFNYNLSNFSAAPGTGGSPYQNPITNARFLSLSVSHEVGKWSHELLGLFAVADKVADGVSALYFNSRTGHYQNQNTSPAQEKGLGFEMDYTLGYEWDEATRFGLSMGLFSPGKFFEFSNSATPNALKSVFASSLHVRVDF
jgi:hypothetical protein